MSFAIGCENAAACADGDGLASGHRGDCVLILCQGSSGRHERRTAVMTITLGGGLAASRRDDGAWRTAGAAVHRRDAQPEPAPTRRGGAPERCTGSRFPARIRAKASTVVKPRGRDRRAGRHRPRGDAAGSAVATPARGHGLGLSTGGGGTGGKLDVGNFCCNEYLTTMIH